MSWPKSKCAPQKHPAAHLHVEAQRTAEGGSEYLQDRVLQSHVTVRAMHPDLKPQLSFQSWGSVSALCTGAACFLSLTATTSFPSLPAAPRETFAQRTQQEALELVCLGGADRQQSAPAARGGGTLLEHAAPPHEGSELQAALCQRTRDFPPPFLLRERRRMPKPLPRT